MNIVLQQILMIENFEKSLYDPNTILITLRINSKVGEIVGYVKGGPLEKHKPKHGIAMKIWVKWIVYIWSPSDVVINDENLGKMNSVFMEWIAIKTGVPGRKRRSYAQIRISKGG